MYSALTKTPGNRRYCSDRGKKICVSFPAHEEHLIDVIDYLAHLECCTRSQWIRRRARDAERQIKTQEKTCWKELLGDN